MIHPKFKAGDRVVSSISPEVNQPMEIVGIDRWFDQAKMDQIIYIVKGTHAKRGNELTVRLTENWLSPHNQ